VYLRAGYSSLFAYCRDVLALSEHEAFNRIEAARTARRFALVLELLAAGEVNLTTVRLLGPHLTAENHVGVLESARGKRKAEVEEIVARLSPRPEVPASVRKLPEPKPAALRGGTLEPLASVTPMGAAAPSPASATAVVPASAEAGRPAPSAGALAAAEGPVAAERDHVASPHARRSAEVAPLSPDRYHYQLTIGGSTLEKLRLAKDMLRHALPSGDDEAILDRALTALLEDLARRKFGARQKTGSSDKASSGKAASPASGRVGAPDSRHVPTPVKRAVWVRDLGRCAFVGTDGRRCGERAFVEFHHVRPYAVGGEAGVANVQLRCRRHNGYEARVYFAREPVGEGPRGVGTGSPAGVSGTTDGSSRGRSGTTRPDRGVVAE
jgi:hypothetical protein